MIKKLVALLTLIAFPVQAAYQPDRDFLTQVALGEITGYQIVSKFGRNGDIDTTTDPEDVWASGALMNWPTAAAVVSCTSTDADDDGAPTTNTGAQTLTINGVDGSFNDQTETITLNGVSAVTTSATFLRINRAFVATTGTYHGSNEGDIVCTIGGSTMITILTGVGQTQVARYTVPNGKTATVIGVNITVGAATPGSNPFARLSLNQNPNADDVSQPYGGANRLSAQFDSITGSYSLYRQGGLKFDGKTDIWFTVDEVSANNTAVAVDFEILVKDD